MIKHTNLYSLNVKFLEIFIYCKILINIYNKNADPAYINHGCVGSITTSCSTITAI